MRNEEKPESDNGAKVELHQPLPIRTSRVQKVAQAGKASGRLPHCVQQAGKTLGHRRLVDPTYQNR